MPRSRAAPAPSSRASAAASRPKPAASSSYSSTPSSSSSGSAQQPQSSSWFGSRPAAPAPAPYSAAPPPATHSSGGGGGIMAGLMGSVVQGAALGTGSAMAHRAMDSMMGPRETRVVHEHQGGAAPEPAPAQLPAHQGGADGPCGDRVKQFAECMSRYNGDMGACQPYFEAMQQCKTTFA